MRSKSFHESSRGNDSRTKRVLRSYDDIVDAYIAEFRRRAAVEMRWYTSRPDYSTLLKLAAMCRTPDDQRHPHQRRIPESALRAAHNRLARCDLQSSTSFDELHDRIDDAIGSLENIGELTVYDISLRVGAFLGLEPQRVYLHRGTRVGARMLGLGRGLNALDVVDLPTAFRRLCPREIEDCLCIYTDELQKTREALSTDIR